MSQLIVIPFFFLTLISCSHQQTVKEIEAKVEQQDYKSIAEIKQDTKTILNEHPEIDEGTKEKIKSVIDMGLDRHYDLKVQESKIVQALLQLYVTPNNSYEEKKVINKKLTQVYKEKGQNISHMINEIYNGLKPNNTNQNFQHDLRLIIREFK